jgi:hypothetical protein
VSRPFEDRAPTASASVRRTAVDGMTNQEILRPINRYIGVSNDGYLGDFTYQTHEEFYPEFCGLDINGKRALNNHE